MIYINCEKLRRFQLFNYKLLEVIFEYPNPNVVLNEFSKNR